MIPAAWTPTRPRKRGRALLPPWRPIGLRWRQADPQEAQARHDQHDARRVQRGPHECRGQRQRQRVPNQQPERRHADRLGSLYELRRRNAAISARATRAYGGQPVAAMAITAVHRPALSAATAIARIRRGRPGTRRLRALKHGVHPTAPQTRRGAHQQTDGHAGSTAPGPRWPAGTGPVDHARQDVAPSVSVPSQCWVDGMVADVDPGIARPGRPAAAMRANKGCQSTDQGHHDRPAHRWDVRKSAAAGRWRPVGLVRVAGVSEDSRAAC